MRIERQYDIQRDIEQDGTPTYVLVLVSVDPQQPPRSLAWNRDRAILEKAARWLRTVDTTGEDVGKSNNVADLAWFAPNG